MTTSLASLRFDLLLDAIAAKSPVPGGGAVAAASGALAAALAGMVVSYSLGRKGLEAHQDHLAAVQRQLAAARRVLLDLADDDAAAFSAMTELRKAPPTTPDLDARRQEAVWAACAVPLAALAACAELLALIQSLLGATNPNLRSDLTVAADLALGAARASRWNVEVNLPSLQDAPLRAKAQADMASMLARCQAAADAVIADACRPPAPGPGAH